MPPGYLIEALRVLKSVGIKRICFGKLDVYKNLIVHIVNRPWNVPIEEIPPCDESIDSTIANASNHTPDLIIEEIKEIYDENNNKQFRLKIKNIGTVDFASAIWVRLTHTKSDIISGHYSEGQKINCVGKTIEVVRVSSSTSHQIVIIIMTLFDF